MKKSWDPELEGDAYVLPTIDNEGNILIPDPWKHRIRVFTITGVLIRDIELGESVRPIQLVVDIDGNLIVCDDGLRVLVLNCRGNLLRTIGEWDLSDSEGSISCIAVDRSGKILVADMAATLHVFSPEGRFLTKYELGGAETLAMGIDANGSIIYSYANGILAMK